MIEQVQDQQLKLKRIYIKAHLPKELAPLRELANNLWWSWQKDGIDLFNQVAGEDKFKELRYNPLALLDQMGLEQAKTLMSNDAFMQQLGEVYSRYQQYMAAKPAPDAPNIAYFCMEYGLHISVRLYSGGLGVLAGDFMKEASDMNVNMFGVGLLYRYGYFQQGISISGDQINNYPPQKFTQMPLIPARNEQGEWIKVSIDYPGRTVFAKVWQLQVGRVTIYLLDTDIDENSWEDRNLTHQLYGGNNEHRLKQEILLGIGGARAVEALGLQPDIYHCNEGHAAFQGMERLRSLMKNAHLSFPEASEVVRSSALFTTHTPVPAGHDYFHEDLMRNYLWQYIHDMGIDWHQFMKLGKVDAGNPNELFSMSHLATRLSQEVNGVSKLHGTVSQKMLNKLYSGYTWEENHIGYVTNSVHYPTWIANEWHQVFSGKHGDNFMADQANSALWKHVDKMSDEDVTNIRKTLKRKLIAYTKKTMQEDLTKRGENPRQIFEIVNNISEDALIIGFARRFATYKRAHLIFTNLERLAKIVNDPERPVMFIFSGKAHPADQGGQALIRQIIEISKRPEFVGKIIFLENYNMESAKLLVQGVDVWLNTPTRPKEASGTSGMKAAMNGVVNFSVLDGWWAEGYRPDAGWALALERTYEDQEQQNSLDAERIYNTFEESIVPTYFERDENGISKSWLSYVRTIMGEVAPYFTMRRMMNHYFERFYTKLHKTGQFMNTNGFENAKRMSTWKAQIRAHWDRIDVLDMDVIDTATHSVNLGDDFVPTIKLNLNGVPSEHVLVEAIFFKRKQKDELSLQLTKAFDLQHLDGGVATYTCKLPLDSSGVYEYGFRLRPTHKALPHAQDIELVRWL